MAAAEYFLGTAAAQKLQQQNQPNLFPPQQHQYPYDQQQQQQPPQHYSSTPPPPYQQYAPQLQEQLQGRPSQSQLQVAQYDQSYPSQPHPYTSNGRPSAPYPTTPPPLGAHGYTPQPQLQPQQSGFLGVPAQPIRSHSQPPRVRFADDKDNSDTSLSYSDSDSSPHRHHRKHRHSHSHSHSRSHRRHHNHSRSSSLDRTDSYDRSASNYRDTRRKEHRDRDTFLGAGAGGIIGDAIFPGLGTAAGLLLGGYGGRKHAKRSHSETPVDREGHHRRRRSRRSGRGEGWDEDTATFKTGTAVR